MVYSTHSATLPKSATDGTINSEIKFVIGAPDSEGIPFTNHSCNTGLLVRHFQLLLEHKQNGT